MLRKSLFRLLFTLVLVLAGVLLAPIVSAAGPGANAKFADMLSVRYGEDVAAVPAEPGNLSMAWRVTTAGASSPVASYTAYRLEEPLGIKKGIAEVWLYTGLDIATNNQNFGGAVVGKFKVAKAAYLVLGVDGNSIGGQKIVWAGIIGFEVLRL